MTKQEALARVDKIKSIYATKKFDFSNCVRCINALSDDVTIGDVDYDYDDDALSIQFSKRGVHLTALLGVLVGSSYEAIEICKLGSDSTWIADLCNAMLATEPTK